MPRGPRMNPAAVALAKHGVAQRQISEPMGYTAPQSVSAQLAGITRPRTDLIPTIRVVAGPDAADEVAEILGVSA